jgi:hypothetical protein
MADIKRNFHQVLKGKKLHSAIYGVHTEVLHDLTAVLKESGAIRKTAKTTMTAPLSIEEFSEQRRRKRKPTDEVDNTAKKSTISPRESTAPNRSRILKFPAGTSSPH